MGEFIQGGQLRWVKTFQGVTEVGEDIQGSTEVGEDIQGVT